MDDNPETRWAKLTGGTSGSDYAARFDALAASGTDVHGEASFCAALLPAGARILDAGCGTGRVAIRLAELGFTCVGADVDDSMLEVASQKAPDVPWFHADLAKVTAADLDDPEPFDLVVLAGNVVPLLAEGTLAAAVRSLAAVLSPGGLFVAGFGLDSIHLPPGCPVTTLDEYDESCRAVGLDLVDRFATWEGEPFSAAEGYAVSVHRR